MSVIEHWIRKFFEGPHGVWRGECVCGHKEASMSAERLEALMDVHIANGKTANPPGRFEDTA